MKKYTNKILIIAGIIVLIGSFILISVTLKKAPQNDDNNCTMNSAIVYEEVIDDGTAEFDTIIYEENN